MQADEHRLLAVFLSSDKRVLLKMQPADLNNSSH